jgi:hypothetical protein
MVRSRNDTPHRDPQHARNGKRRDEPLCGGHAQQRRRHGPRRMIVTGFVVMMGHGFLYSVTVRGCRWRRRGNREDRAKGQGKSNRLLGFCESPILLGLRASRHPHRPPRKRGGRVGESGREGRASRGRQRGCPGPALARPASLRIFAADADQPACQIVTSSPHPPRQIGGPRCAMGA